MISRTIADTMRQGQWQGGGAVVGGAEFVLGLNPVFHNADANADMTERTRPLVAYLTRAMGAPVRVVVEPDYDAQIAAMRAGEVDAALFGEYAFHRARTEAGAEALAVAVEAGSEETATYQSAIIAGAETPIRALADLAGRRVGFVDRGSTAGYLIPRRMLREAGLDPDADLDTVFLHGHRAVLDAVIAGEVAAGAMHRQTFVQFAASDPDGAARLRTVAVSPPVPKGPLAVRRGLNRETRQRLLQALLRIHEEAPEAARMIAAPGTRWRPASNRSVTLKTVAALSGVSYGTVSRVVNGRSHVAPETYARVMSIVQDLGFRPNAAAVSLIAGRSNLVGFLVPDATDAVIARLITGLQRALIGEGLHLVVCPTGDDRDEEAHYLGLLDDGRFGGMLLTEWSRDTPLVSTLAATGRPLVLLGAAAGSAPVTGVSVDIHALARAAADHLGTLGHTRIGAVVPTGWEGDTTHAFADAGIAATVRSVTPETAITVVRDLLTAAAPPTALVCGDEQGALVALAVACERGITVPDDLSVVVLAESWVAAVAAPPLTAVAPPLEALAARAVALLVEQMSAGETPPESLPPLPAPVLTVRDSTAAVR